MVVISIKLSDGSVVRSRHENGSCSVSGASVVPVKWKPRKVSAVRVFPPGCGPNAQPINAVTREAEPLSSTVANNHVVNDAGTDDATNNHVANDAGTDDATNNHVANDTGTDNNHVANDAGTDNNHVANDAGTDDAGTDDATNNHVANDAGTDNNHVANYAGTNDATNNHVANDAGTDGVANDAGTNDAGTNDATNNYVANDAGTDGVANDAGTDGVANDAGADEPVGLVVESLVNNEVQNGDTQVDNGGSGVKEAILKMKFTRRRVSAVRDFPPYCGLNAEEPTEEERIRITGRRSSGSVANGGVKDESVNKTQLNESKDPFMADQEMQTIVESDINVEDEKIMVAGPSKKVQNIGQACQELVVYTRDKDLKKSSPVDDAVDADYEEDVRDNKPLSLTQTDMNIKNREVRSKKNVKKRPLDDTKRRVYGEDKIKVVVGLKAPSFCAPGIQEQDLANKVKGQASTTPKTSPNKKQKKKQEKVDGGSTSTGKVAYTGTLEIVEKDLTNKRKGDVVTTPKKSTKKEQKNQEKIAYTGTLEMVVRKEEDFTADVEEKEEFLNLQGTNDVDVSLPPFGPKSSNDARNKVRETLRLFQALCRKLLQGEEARPDDLKLPKRRVDLAAKAIMDKRGRLLDLGKKTHGPVPGIEVGDEFQYRVELALVGIHRPYQGGIDFVKKGKDYFAVSVVASGGYDNEVDKPDCLMYSGSGGIAKDKSYENQKLERGNLALKNNIELKYPVRVVRGYKVKSFESPESKSKLSTTYIYDGLYTVESCLKSTGRHGTMVFKFELKRVPGQPQLAIREVKSKKFKTREGVCVKDITNGKEPFPICAINTIDDKKPPEFTYITKIMYPDCYKPIPPKGCDCVGRCSDKRCPCAFRNGGEIPYNRNGAIVEAKPLVYECGPSCGCPPTCYNRVTQHGMKIHLEIFKTESRGWGVRSLSSIASGSFICEYIGELLEDTEAEKRTSNDEYLFDIGQNYSDCSLNPDSGEMVNSGGGFTIDAALYGNVGRFINHSCSPNLYAQNVLYDQDDKRMPHIMLFAAENIPPLKELTYHYNYTLDTVHDADGNIKVKSCYCGSPECTGRMY